MLKRILSVAMVSILLLTSFKAIAYAHPIDNTDSYFYFEKEVDQSDLPENVIKAYSYMNWQLAAMLVERETSVIEYDIYKLINYEEIYSNYVQSKIIIKNNGSNCVPIHEPTPAIEDQFSISLGALIITSFNCQEKIENVSIENSMFIDDLLYQSNFTSIYNSDQLLHAVTLGKDRLAYNFNAADLKANPKGDETIDNSANMTTDQVTIGNAEIAESEESIQNVPKGPKEAGFISKITDVIFLRTNTIKDQSVFMLLGLVFLLGFLHTIEAGHSKAILASAMLHKKMDIKRGLIYASVFTLTHLGDIIIVGLILLAADNYFDVMSNFTVIERIAGYALFIMAIYMLLKNLRHLLHHKLQSHHSHQEHIHGHDHHHGHSHENLIIKDDISLKDQVLLGFLAGLAPCVFGWSIFMLILSTKSIWILIPAILIFGIGIFVALAIIVLVMTNLKKGPYSRFEKVANYSPIVSALLLLGYSIWLIS